MNLSICRSDRHPVVATFAAVLLVASATLAPPAQARDAARSVRVSLADLDLGSEAGAAALYRRIHAAAHGVCDGNSTRGIALLTKVKPCRDEVIARAAAQVPSPAFAAWYAKKTGQPEGIRVAQQR